MMRATLVGAALFVIAGVSAGGARQGGSAAAVVSGELRQWHKVTLTFNGPQASETDSSPNPFTDYRMTVVFTHESGAPRYEVPGYFAADGDAANTSATSGNKWRVHVSPDKVGRWNWRASMVSGPGVAVTPTASGQAVAPVDGATGSFDVAASNKTAPDFRAKGRLQYVGKHYLRFAGSGEYFLKAGPDSPETLLAYEDFDNTRTLKTAIHAYAPHVQDWKNGDPTWAKTKGKALIGAINYLASKGMNAMSLMPYNAGGDGDNVWPFVDRDDKFHYDVSKLDQWQIVFDHAQAKGIYLHFKLQEQENDDGRAGGGGGGGGRGGRGGAPGAVGRGAGPAGGAPAAQPAPAPAAPPAAAAQAGAAPEGRGAGGRGAGPAAPCPVPASLDCGDTGRERRLYLRELVARFGYELALNWNMGEENTQTTAQQRAMAQYIHDVDPYDHIVVVHTFPNQQEDVYQPHLGQTLLQGLSLQNAWNAAHQQTARWVRGSAAAGVPWVVANDEQGSASTGVPPDPGYPGFTGKDNQGNQVQSLHDIRKLTLWGNLMARWRRRGVLLRLRPARQRPDARELPQPGQVLGLRTHRADVLPQREDSVLGHDQCRRAGRQPHERQQHLLLREARRRVSGLPAIRRIGRSGPDWRHRPVQRQLVRSAQRRSAEARFRRNGEGRREGGPGYGSGQPGRGLARRCPPLTPWPKRVDCAVPGSAPGIFRGFQYEAWTRIPEVEMVAIYNRTEERARALMAQYGIPRFYGDWKEMLDRERPDFVDIITPPETHEEMCAFAAARGIHIICQKPLAPTYEDSQRIVDDSTAAGVRFMVHENFRWQPWYRAIKDVQVRGDIGDFTHVHFLMRMGDGWGEDAYLARQPFFREYPRLLIYETGVHFIDTFRFLLGDVVERRRRDETTQPGDPRRGRRPDAAEVPERVDGHSGMPIDTTSQRPNRRGSRSVNCASTARPGT